MLKHVALVHQPALFLGSDYVAIAGEIQRRCNDIRVFIYPDVQMIRPHALLSQNPLMTFCPTFLRFFQPPRGKVFCGQPIRKDEQLRLLAKGGVRVPKWVYAKPNLQLSEHEWGPHVIIKPIKFGYASEGRGIELVRTSSYRPVAPAAMSFQGKTPSEMIVQQFIDSGPYSEDYRVVTLFGSVLYALRRRSATLLERPTETNPRTSRGVVSNAAAGEGRDVTYCYDKDVLAFAASCYRAIPQVPFHAVDVRRDIHNGRLYCLEINPGGQTWHFSSPRAKTVPTIEGIRREDQFGAWGIAAEALIEKVRLFAA
jgi:hypothetical protein